MYPLGLFPFTYNRHLRPINYDYTSSAFTFPQIQGQKLEEQQAHISSERIIFTSSKMLGIYSSYCKTKVRYINVTNPVQYHVLIQM